MVAADLGEFSTAFGTAFDPPYVLKNQFSAAFANSFDPPVWTPIAFTLTGTGLLTPGYRLAVEDPAGELLVVNTITAATDDRIEFTWSFNEPGTHYLVVVDAVGLPAGARLPIVVTA